MTTVHFTKHHNSKGLSGLKTRHSLRFCNLKSAESWSKSVQKHGDRQPGGRIEVHSYTSDEA